MEPPQPQYGRIVDTGDRAELRLLVTLSTYLHSIYAHIYTVSTQYLHSIYTYLDISTL